MSNKVSPNSKNMMDKTRKAILRMKNCSPKLRDVLRQRCQERIRNDRLKILNSLRQTNIQGSFRLAVSNILCEEWKNIDDDDDELCEPLPDDLQQQQQQKIVISPELNLEEELELEEALQKELISQHEEWLLQQYDELVSSENFFSSNDVVCPLCCLGYLEEEDCVTYQRAICPKCSSYFTIERSIIDLQSAIFDCLIRHDDSCTSVPKFANIHKNENENNLCVICYKCSLFDVLV